MIKNSKRDKIPTGAVLSKEGGRVDSDLLYIFFIKAVHNYVNNFLNYF